VRVPLRLAAVAADDHAAGAESNPRVDARPKVGVAPVARVAAERPGEAGSVALGDAPGEADVLAGAVELPVGGRLPREFVQAFDSLDRDAHGRTDRVDRPKAFRSLAPPFEAGSVKPPPEKVGRDVSLRALNYLELESELDRSGIGTATDQQRAALSRTDVDVVTSPWRGGGPARASLSALRGRGPFDDYDLAHCNLVGPASVAVARHARRNGLPLILHAHVTREDFAESFRGSTAVGPVLGRYLRWFYSQADLVLCPSAYTKRVLESYPVDAPILPVTNGVDAESLSGFETLREEYRERYDLDGMVVFAVGNVFERKGLTTFCELARATDYDFAWFGPYDAGPHASKTVRRWVENPPENVTFTGWIDDVRGAFGAGDVYLFPTKNENQGIAVLEAMACGKAVVLRDIPVFEEFYTHGHDCLKCSTPAEFERALDLLARDDALRRRLGENARETAAEHDLDRVGETLAAAYREVDAAKREGRPPDVSDLR
jgi:glycosyltransferase involved in cell wall biosynthesis